MLDLTSLLFDRQSEGDELRYGTARDEDDGSQRKPVVVFNLTRDCNLECVHCYSGSKRKRFPGQLETETIKETLHDLADFGIPALLLSGGEPLVHRDFDDILRTVEELGLRTTLSTNGTLIDEAMARKLHDSCIRYVGISLDGLRDLNDDFRGVEGAFERAVNGIRNCKDAGQKVGLRMTLTSYNHDQLPGIFEFIREENIDRVCFYHLAYAGRGKDIAEADLTDRQRRNAIETIIAETRKSLRMGHELEVLTVANPVDNAYLYKRILREDPEDAERVKKYLEWNGGGLNSSGVGIGSIDFYGRVHPNQFWMDRTLGNVKNRPFSEIWTDDSNELLRKLRTRKDRLGGDCASCPFLEMCGGGLRLRAEADGDLWGTDPSCYLTDREREHPEFLAGNPGAVSRG